MTKTLLLLAILAAFCSCALSSSWELCSGSEDYKVKISDVQVSPDPVRAGRKVTFTVFANTSEPITSGKLIINVYFYSTFVHKEEDNLCKKASCPILPGEFVIKSSQSMPIITPPGNYKVKLEVSNGSELLSCAEVLFDVHWWLSAEM